MEIIIEYSRVDGIWITHSTNYPSLRVDGKTSLKSLKEFLSVMKVAEKWLKEEKEQEK